SPLAPAPLFLPVQLVGRLFRAPRLACRVTSHHQPDQNDQEDRWSDDLQDPQGGFVHPLPPVPGTARRFTLYSSRWRDWVPGSSPTRKASMSGPPTHGSILLSPSPKRSSPMAIPTMHAAGMERCWRRPRPWQSWKCAADRRRGGLWPMTKRSVSMM